MTPIIALRKLRRNLRDYGLGITARKALMHLFKWCYLACDYRIYRIDLDAFTPRTPAAGSLQYRFITVNDRALIAAIEEMEEWLEGLVEGKLQGGGICLVVTDDQRLAGFNLVGFDSLHIPCIERTHRFRERAAWSEQISVSHDFRGKGIASELRYRIFAHLKTRGVRWFYGGAMRNNEASLKLARRVGFRELFDIRFRRVLTYRTWRFAKVRAHS